MRWNGIFEDGRDCFMFLPDAANAFSYKTSARFGAKTITPRLMPTDGGSIPRVLWGLSNFSPWGYAPGYMVHDWLFVAHKLQNCARQHLDLRPGGAHPRRKHQDADGGRLHRFRRSQAQAREGRGYAHLIFKAVGSDIAKQYWDDPTPIDCRDAQA